jgi:gas vesicle protein
MSEQESDFGAYLAGFIIGGLIGAATALLLAPQSGEETRTMIRDKSIEIKDRASATAEEALEKASATLDETRTRLTATVEDLRKRVDEMSTQMRKDEEAMTKMGGEETPPAV